MKQKTVTPGLSPSSPNAMQVTLSLAEQRKNMNANDWLKLIGSLLIGTGSILLAIRVKKILDWIVYSVVAHEISIQQIQRIIEGKLQTQPISNNVTKHLLSTIDGIGIWLLVLGFSLFGLGNLLVALTYLE